MKKILSFVLLLTLALSLVLIGCEPKNNVPNGDENNNGTYNYVIEDNVDNIITEDIEEYRDSEKAVKAQELEDVFTKLASSESGFPFSNELKDFYIADLSHPVNLKGKNFEINICPNFVEGKGFGLSIDASFNNYKSGNLTIDGSIKNLVLGFEDSPEKPEIEEVVGRAINDSNEYINIKITYAPSFINKIEVSFDSFESIPNKIQSIFEGMEKVDFEKISNDLINNTIPSVINDLVKSVEDLLKAGYTVETDALKVSLRIDKDAKMDVKFNGFKRIKTEEDEYVNPYYESIPDVDVNLDGKAKAEVVLKKEISDRDITISKGNINAVLKGVLSFNPTKNVAPIGGMEVNAIGDVEYKVGEKAHAIKAQFKYSISSISGEMPPILSLIYDGKIFIDNEQIVKSEGSIEPTV